MTAALVEAETFPTVKEPQYLVLHDEDGTPVSSLPAHRLENEPHRRDRKVWFWVAVGVLVFTKSQAHTWRGWEFEAGRLVLSALIVYAVGYVAYSAWDRLAWHFQLGPRMRDSAGQRWVIDD